MKFTCDHCQARYQIPDEKVVGRKLKYVCRKCQTPIILDGTTQTATTVEDSSARPSMMPAALSIAPASMPPPGISLPPADDAPTIVPASLPPSALFQAIAQPAAASKEASQPPAANRTPSQPPELPIWHVAIDGTPRGPMRLAQVRAHLERGEAHPASLAWRDGQEDWLPLAEIPALAALLPPIEEPSAAPAPVATAAAAANVEPPAPTPAAALVPEPTVPSEPQAPRVSMPPPRLSLESESAAATGDDDLSKGFGKRSGPSPLLMLGLAVAAAVLGGFVVHLMEDSSERTEAEATAAAVAAAGTTGTTNAASAGGSPAQAAVGSAIADNAMTDVGADDSLANALAGVVDAGAVAPTPTASRTTSRAAASAGTAAGTTDTTPPPVTEPSAPEPVAIRAAPSGPELTAAQIREVYRRNQGRVQSCYDRAATMAGNAPDVRLQVAVRILPSGEVGRVNITGNDFGGLSACVQRVVQSWQFPASAQGGQTTFPFVFSGM